MVCFNCLRKYEVVITSEMQKTYKNEGPKERLSFTAERSCGCDNVGFGDTEDAARKMLESYVAQERAELYKSLLVAELTARSMASSALAFAYATETILALEDKIESGTVFARRRN